MKLLVARSARFQEHQPGRFHPERPERLAAIDRALDRAVEEGLVFEEVTPRPASDAELLRTHTEAHLRRLEEAAGRTHQLDPDTVTSPASVAVARLAAGTGIDILGGVLASRGRAGMALVRPPGHHALADRAMGFCLLSNLGIAVRQVLDSGTAQRVAIYDWDVHHGNGTQALFYQDPRVLFMSTHQWPFYPGTGAAQERGAGQGEGLTVNLPLPAGTTDRELIELTETVLAPKVRAFRPDLIVISAGYDAHQADPIGGFEMTTSGFRQLATRWRDLAEEVCEGRIAGFLEGGYDLDALSASVRATLEAWA